MLAHDFGEVLLDILQLLRSFIWFQTCIYYSSRICILYWYGYRYFLSVIMTSSSLLSFWTEMHWLTMGEMGTNGLGLGWISWRVVGANAINSYICNLYARERTPFYVHIDFIVVSTKAKQMAGITFDTRRLSRNLSRAKKEAVGKRGSGVRNPEQGFRSGRQMNGKHTHTIRFPLHKSFVISFK